MNASIVSSPMRRLHLHVAIFTTLVLTMLFGLAPLAPSATAQPVGSTAPLIRVSTVEPLNQIAVHGEGFTPGGLVRLSVVSSANNLVSRQMWVVASDVAYGPNGSQDPVWNHGVPGAVDAVIPLGTTTIFGPNGSQDPARGFTQQQGLFDGPMCALSFDVQALDHKTGAVSALAHIAPSCGDDQGSNQEPVAAPESDPDDELPPVRPNRNYSLPY